MSTQSYRLITQDIQKPDLDDRSYRLIELPNKLQALIVHDPTTDKSAAALDCNVGAFNDPKDLPGLAHFLEHLLFMGTEKYPNENEYSSYLSKHSGHSNAYTSSMDTNYFFEINYNYLEGALDRFAQFFIHPLFNKNCKDREIKLVDSENKKNLQNDNWRLSQLEKSLTNPNHPYNGFSTGNLQTLGDIPTAKGLDVREELIKFYKEHYSANLMKLVIIGREDLDTLTEWVVTKFSPIPNQNKSRPYFELEPFDSANMLKLIKLKPVMSTKSMEITFATPDQLEHWQIQPLHYYSHLIGHEGKGSILYLLKEKGWASGLSSGSMNISKGYSVFSISIELTDKGLQHYQEICSIVFQYLRLLKKSKPQDWIFQELKQISETNFKFKQKTSVSGTASKLSNVLNKVHESMPYEFILSQHVLRKYDEAIIERYSEYFNTDNFRILLVSSTFSSAELNQKEKWYGTEYSVESLSPEFLSKLSSDPIDEKNLHLPGPNEFIPSDLDVVKVPGDKLPLSHPHLIRSNSSQRLWFKKDDQFYVPKGAISTMFHIPISQCTPVNSTLTTIYLEMVDDYLNDIAYDASIVGLHFNLTPTRDGFTLNLSGYNDKMSVLLEKVVDTLLSFKPSPERFDLIKEKTLKEYKNFGYSVPYAQIGYYSTFLLYDQSWSIDEKIEALEKMTHQNLVNFIPSLYSQLFLETLVAGNFDKSKAIEIFDLYQNKFSSIPNLSESQVITGRSTLIAPDTKYRYELDLKDEKNVNSCIEYLIQLGELTDTYKLTLADLVAQVSHEPCFNELRTKQQLGYVVFSGVKRTRTTFGYRVLIQSERTTDYLEYRIDDFLVKFGKRLSNFTEEEFKKNVESLIAKKLLKIKNLNEEVTRFWGKIGSGYYDFNSREEQVKILEKITLKELVDYYHNDILSSSNSKLVVHLKSQAAPVQKKQKLINITISNNIENDSGFSTNKLEEIINKYQFSSFDSEEISAFLNSKEFQELISSREIDLQSLHKLILSDLKNPTPEKYPTGKLIGSVADFKAENILTGTAKPVVPLSEFVDEDDVNWNAKLHI